MPDPLRLSAVAGAETGSGPPLVLVHGLGGTWEYWARTMRLLASRARCIALDVPGFGQSDAPPGGFGLDSAADGLAAALGELGCGPAVLCGHSLGGPLVARLALRHPEAVSGLVLAGPSGLAPTPAWQQRVLGAMPVYDALRSAPLPWERWLVSLTPLSHAGFGLLVDDPSTVDPALARRLMDGLRSARELGPAAVLSLETGLAEECALVRACGHLPMIERPEAFAAALAQLALV